ncbi:MAG: hypothetical protein REI78_13510 [Pedobacter sp.]|nr:hypothetical protein [Pedobacter sp.]
MAIIKGNYIKGIVGNLTYREHQGQQLVQGKAHTIPSHRTEATRKAAKFFGKASKLARGIRWGLAEICHKYSDGTMNFRLNTEILRCLNVVKDSDTQQLNLNPHSFRNLAGFEFNAGSMVKNHFFVQPQVSLQGTTLKVDIPDLNIPVDVKFPKDRLDRCTLMIAVEQVDLENSLVSYAEIQLMDIPFSYRNTEVPGQSFQFEIEPGCLCITAISLQYIEKTFVGENIINSKKFNPSAILHAQIAEGEVDSAKTKDWWNYKL